MATAANVGLPEIHYTVDDESQITTARELTPTQILKLAEIDPNTNYLVQIEGEHQITYQGKPNVELHIHNEMKFISVYTGPTPVS